jgi:hypothetical protein
MPNLSSVSSRSCCGSFNCVVGGGIDGLTGSEGVGLTGRGCEARWIHGSFASSSHLVGLKTCVALVATSSEV